MKFKVNVEVVTGFLEAGKTTFINALTKRTLIDDEKLIIIQCEQGEQIIDESIQLNVNAIVHSFDAEDCISKEFLINMNYLHKPDRIIIEYNGCRKIEKLLAVFNEREVSKLFKISAIYNIIDAKNFNLYITNMPSLILDSIYNSNLIVVNNTDNVKENVLEKIIEQLENYNLNAYIITTGKVTEISSVLENSNIFISKDIKKIFLKIKNLLLGTNNRRN